MKPSECKDRNTVNTELNEQGCHFNDVGLELIPPNVILHVGPCVMKINQIKFEHISRWYMEDQGEKIE